MKKAATTDQEALGALRDAAAQHSAEECAWSSIAIAVITMITITFLVASLSVLLSCPGRSGVSVLHERALHASFSSFPFLST